MVRIAGIDRDFTELELMFHQADEEEKAELVAGYLANLTVQVGAGIRLRVELESDKVVEIETSIKKAAKSHPVSEGDAA